MYNRLTTQWDHHPPGTLVVAVAGDVDAGTAPRLTDAISTARAENADASHLLLDLTAVTFLDSSGLAVLVETASTCNRAGQSLLLIANTSSVLRPLQLTGLDEILPITAKHAAAPVTPATAN
ncbi:STAS domain-containing protein [Amycolatopsis thermoflava]|uniref:STAS domain-containing protein n=1 Tax=Amycolatopsis thermoflava TaxID=84480 RepID=UPI003648F2E0